MNQDEIRNLSDDALNRAIAERSGCRVEVSDAGRFRVLDLQGEPVSPTWHRDEDTAWRYALLPDRLPDWTHDIDQCLRDLDPLIGALGSSELVIYPTMGRATVWVEIRCDWSYGDFTHYAEVEAPSRKRALAELLLIALTVEQK
ncbi:MAG TPA: hypothetical protein PKD09_10680 [Aggregatilinea sp.]|uniref:hypothetical protein n=1 Tax=Aggregatilinea sp. TaxID=2806333 RepID=UPI002CFBAD1A|nr:hypothetical protein [Aggregatilinea sp.]HML22108.1 hypothetical protein [Aggregatilinea sp.]